MTYIPTNITYSAAQNPVWANLAKTMIDVEVNFDHVDFEEWTVFTADPNDPSPHGGEIYNACVAGDFGTIADYVAPADITGDDAMTTLRSERDRLLAETDWWAMQDRTMTTEQTTYRTLLRDLPANSTGAILRWTEDEGYTTWVNVTWPTKPE